MSVEDDVRNLIDPLVSADGLELVDVEHGPGLLRVYLDREGGIDLDAITRASEQISDLLDVHDPVPGRYTLEVSSPGLERPLKTPTHFQRFVGQRVSIKTKAGVPGDRRFAGVLEAADDDGIVVDGRRLAYRDLEKAKTVFEWGPTPKPGSTKNSKKATTT